MEHPSTRRSVAYWLAAVWVLILLAVLQARATPLASLPPAEREALLKLKAAFESAAQGNRLHLLWPYLEEDFRGKMLLMDLNSREELKALWEQIDRKFGEEKGVRRYHLEIIPESLDISGDTALAGGRTKESIETPLGPVTYHSVWSARLVKKDGAWKIARMESKMDALDKISRGLNTVVRAVWTAIQLPSGIRREQPDFDKDGTAGYKPAE